MYSVRPRKRSHAIEVHGVLLPESRGIALGLWLQVALIAISICALPFDTRKALGINP